MKTGRGRLRAAETLSRVLSASLKQIAENFPLPDESFLTMQKTIVEFYSCPSAMTSAEKYKDFFDELPNDVGERVRIIQGLGLYEHVASEFYGVEISAERRNESHFRSVEQMLERLLELDDKPLTVSRPPEKRLVGVCHHFMLLLVAMLRAKSIPARV